MKKISTLIIVLIFTTSLMLFGCGKKSSEQSTDIDSTVVISDTTLVTE